MRWNFWPLRQESIEVKPRSSPNHEMVTSLLHFHPCCRRHLHILYGSQLVVRNEASNVLVNLAFWFTKYSRMNFLFFSPVDFCHDFILKSHDLVSTYSFPEIGDVRTIHPYPFFNSPRVAATEGGSNSCEHQTQQLLASEQALLLELSKDKYSSIQRLHFCNASLSDLINAFLLVFWHLSEWGM